MRKPITATSPAYFKRQHLARIVREHAALRAALEHQQCRMTDDN